MFGRFIIYMGCAALIAVTASACSDSSGSGPQGGDATPTPTPPIGIGNNGGTNGDDNGGGNNGTGATPTPDPSAVPGCIDADNDGFGAGCPQTGDCDDSRSDVSPLAPELCGDGVDNNCDGATDEADDACRCRGVETRPCFDGPAGAELRAPCRSGFQQCSRGQWSVCISQVLPEDEKCDGLDNDCDGRTDENLLNRCGTCGTEPAEVCNDGLDNDCDGVVDQGCIDPCDGFANTCYTGPPQTLDQGACRAGTRSCNGGSWGACQGSVEPEEETCNGVDDDCDGLTDEGVANRCGTCGELPAETCNGEDDDCDGLTDEGLLNACGGCGAVPEEACGDGLDNDCDGLVDERCPCEGRTEQACYTGPAHTRGQGGCLDGIQVCGEVWGPCEGEVLPQPETCDSKDNNCDGFADDSFDSGESCTVGRGACQRTGTMVCSPDGLGTVCSEEPGEPAPEEICSNQIDDDCDSFTDEGCEGANAEPSCDDLVEAVSPPHDVVELQAIARNNATDADGEITSFRWDLIAAPAGSARTVANPDAENTTFSPDIVGQYVIRLKLVDDRGGQGSCKVTINAISNERLRIEMWWNEGLGSDDSDVDLHLLHPNARSWAINSSEGNDCHWRNCIRSPLSWPPGGGGDDPRLDLDDIDGFGPENINIDTPAIGLTYRVGAHFWDRDSTPNPTRVKMRIYCDGQIAQVFGGADGQVMNAQGNNNAANDFWKVADVIFNSAAPGDCTVIPIDQIVQADSAASAR